AQTLQSAFTGAIKIMQYNKKLRIDKWLRRHLNLGDLHGLQWLINPQQRLFKVSWSHKSGQSWSCNIASRKDNVFLAYHQARLPDCLQAHSRLPDSGNNKKKQKLQKIPDYKRLKQNFRCALRGSRYIRYEPTLSQSRGCDAYRVYRLLLPNESGLEEADYNDEEEATLEQPDEADQQELQQLPCLDRDVDLDRILQSPASDPRDELLPLMSMELDELDELDILMTDDAETPDSQSPISSSLSSPPFDLDQPQFEADEDLLKLMFSSN
uniref:IRF tryptophan pentad repeat domain-containing protein n=1 Tax=Macrostomum lignano TaxID=282301 RepID=A0A1I8JBS5_9PLAT